MLADPEGNDSGVIEPGNSCLADCGFLGEFACDGTRGVGLFWAKALSWSLERASRTADLTQISPPAAAQAPQADRPSCR